MSRILRNLCYTLLSTLLFSCDIQGGGLYPGGEKLAYTAAKERFLRVKRVVDGDTFWVDNGSEKGLKVRLIGVDAPESRKVFNRDVEYFGKEAAAYLTKMLSGKKVKLVSDVGALDRYGRTLSYVYLEDGTFVNAELIKNGYAQLMTIAPNVAYAEYFAKLQREAREKRKGMWFQLSLE